MTIHGYGAAAYGIPNLPHSNIIWGYCILFIDQFLKLPIPAYSIIILSSLILTASGLFFLMTIKSNNIFIALFCTVLMFAQPIVRPQFTLLAGFITVLSLFCLYYYQRFTNKAIVIISALLLYAGFLIRYEEMLLIICISIPLIPWRICFSRSYLMGILGILSLIIILSGWWDSNLSKEKRQYKDNFGLSRMLDYGDSESLKISESVLSKNDFSKNDYELITSWFFIDSALTNPLRLTKIVNDAKVPFNLYMLPDSILKGLRVLLAGDIIILFIGSIIIFIFFPSRQLFYVWMLLLLALLTFSFLGRPFPYRVIYPALSLCMCTPFMLSPEKKALSSNRTRILVFILIVFSIIHVFAVLRQGNRREWKALEVQKMMQDFPDNPVVIWPADFPAELAYPLLSTYDEIKRFKLQTLGGILAFYPNSFTRTEAKAGRGMLQLFYSSNGVSVLGFPSRFLLLENYCKEQGGIYRDSFLKVIGKCEIRQCFCEQ